MGPPALVREVIAMQAFRLLLVGIFGCIFGYTAILVAGHGARDGERNRAGGARHKQGNATKGHELCLQAP